MTDERDDERRAPSTALEVHARHADFVWSTLYRLGVPSADRADVLQEVFLVVHRRVADFDGRSKVTTWLYSICVRVVSGWRRTRRRRPEVPTVEHLDAPFAATQESSVSAREARVEVARALDGLDVEKRAVFVMFELEDLSCAEIAEIVGVPVGTVHSRLHAARAEFAACVRAGRRSAR